MTSAEDQPQDLNQFLTRIRGWYERDHQGFATLYDAAIANVKPRPAGVPDAAWYDWKNRKIDDLCAFFVEWYKAGWTTKPSEGLNYIEKFSWINYQNDYGMVFVTSGPGLEMTRYFTCLQGMQMDADGEQAQKLIELWKKELGSRMDDFEDKRWDTFNEFFVRELKDKKKRPIDAPADNSVVVAPTDCVINMIVDDLTDETPVPVKTVTMNVKQLLNNSKYYEKFVQKKDASGKVTQPGGTAVSCILMPDTYHWYHAPVAGEVVQSCDDVGGIYYGMRDFPALLNKGNVGYGFDYEMFDNFRRGFLIFSTKFKDPHGKEHQTYVGMVTVGLNSIASVNYLPEFKNPQEPVPVTKGQKIGNFMYGGSLNILLFEYGRFPALQLHMGQRIGNLETTDRTESFFTRHHYAAAGRRALII